MLPGVFEEAVAAAVELLAPLAGAAAALPPFPFFVSNRLTNGSFCEALFLGLAPSVFEWREGGGGSGDGCGSPPFRVTAARAQWLKHLPNDNLNIVAVPEKMLPTVSRANQLMATGVCVPFGLSAGWPVGETKDTFSPQQDACPCR